MGESRTILRLDVLEAHSSSVMVENFWNAPSAQFLHHLYAVVNPWKARKPALARQY